MTIPISVAILFVAGGTLIMASAFMFYAMVGKVNQKLPEDQRTGYLGFYPALGAVGLAVDAAREGGVHGAEVTLPAVSLSEGLPL